jgi:hypothetical protein
MDYRIEMHRAWAELLGIVTSVLLRVSYLSVSDFVDGSHGLLVATSASGSGSAKHVEVHWTNVQSELNRTINLFIYLKNLNKRSESLFLFCWQVKEVSTER